jgi:hypothetical protein
MVCLSIRHRGSPCACQCARLPRCLPLPDQSLFSCSTGHSRAVLRLVHVSAHANPSACLWQQQYSLPRVVHASVIPALPSNHLSVIQRVRIGHGSVHTDPQDQIANGLSFNLPMVCLSIQVRAAILGPYNCHRADKRARGLRMYMPEIIYIS